MGHSHLHAVLIFYGWTAVASFGCLLAFVFPVYFGIDSSWAFLILGIGFVILAALTLAPLGRRKRQTVAASPRRRPLPRPGSTSSRAPRPCPTPTARRRRTAPQGAR